MLSYVRVTITQGHTVGLYINNELLGGAQSVQLKQQAYPINITNQINAEWQEYIPGIKQWGVIGDGFYITDKQAFDTLTSCFMDNKEIDVKVDNRVGRALIVDFPLSTTFNDQYKYRIELLGTGELKIE